MPTRRSPSRRKFLHLAAGAGALSTIWRSVGAQTYPSRQVHWITGFAPGGVSSILAGLIGQWLSERLGQPFVIENRPGAGSTIAADAVAKAMPDGYTLYWSSSADAVNASVHDKLNFNFIRDIMPVTGITRVPNIVVVNPSLPVKTIPEFIAYAKANPGKLNFASSGVGTTSHVTGELFKMMTGVNLVHVPYRGSGPAMIDMFGGQVQVMFDNMPSVLEYIMGGRLRALAVTTRIRSDLLAEVPTVAETVPGYESSTWFGVGVPRHTPPEIVEILNKGINAALADPKIKARVTGIGGVSLAGTPAEFGKLIVEETEKWAKVVKFAGIKPD